MDILRECKVKLGLRVAWIGTVNTTGSHDFLKDLSQSGN